MPDDGEIRAPVMDDDAAKAAFVVARNRFTFPKQAQTVRGKGFEQTRAVGRNTVAKRPAPLRPVGGLAMRRRSEQRTGETNDHQMNAFHRGKTAAAQLDEFCGIHWRRQWCCPTPCGGCSLALDSTALPHNICRCVCPPLVPLFVRCALGAFTSLGIVAHAADLDPPASPAAPAADFETQIKPLLERNCLRCHGAEKQKSDFRIDSRDGLLRGGENGKAIIEGKSAESPLIHYVARVIEDLEMPPKKEEALSAEQIGWLRAWLDAGAPWPNGTKLTAQKESGSAAGDAQSTRENHWAFKPPQRPPLPAVKDPGWIATPVDQFILARLEREQLHPAPEADKATLLRRLSLDLIGLPPTIEEIDTFLNDARPDAYSRQVERLLASPHYGERWARHWLDAARYADSDGYEKDKPRSVYFYRDWVVNALNRDLPYDRFVIEQLAGDLLPNPTQEQRIATGFLRNSMLNEEGGVDPEQFRMESMFDRMDALGKSVLGLTIQCAQCHDHKFDPISQKEYYQLFAFLNNDDESQPRRLHADGASTTRIDSARNRGEGTRIKRKRARLGATHGGMGKRSTRQGCDTGNVAASFSPSSKISPPTGNVTFPCPTDHF